MLAIRMQRTGRKGHAMFRVVVQDARRTPTSGKVVAQIGSYDPHSKSIILQKDKASFYLEHGAQPSDRVVRLLVSEGVKLPDWVKKASTNSQRTVRNPEKLRRNRSAGAVKAETSAPEANETNESVVEPESSAAGEASTPTAQEPGNPNEAGDTAADPAPTPETDAPESEAADSNKQ